MVTSRSRAPRSGRHRAELGSPAGWLVPLHEEERVRGRRRRRGRGLWLLMGTLVSLLVVAFVMVSWSPGGAPGGSAERAAAGSPQQDGATDGPAGALPEVEPAQILRQDISGDGVEDTVLVYVDENGRPSYTEADTDADGRVDMWGWFEDGKEIGEVAYDRDGDGRPDEWERYEEARLVERRRDTNHDAAPDQWSLYGEDGELVETRRDTDGDGLVDVWSMNAADGRLQRAVYDSDGDGRADRWIDYRVDGSIAWIETDSDGDGTPDQRVVPKRR